MFGVYVHYGIGVVSEDHVRCRESEGRFAHVGIATEIEAVRLVKHVLVAPKEDSVVERGGELTCPSADVDGTVATLNFAADDRARPDIALGSGPATMRWIGVIGEDPS